MEVSLEFKIEKMEDFRSSSSSCVDSLFVFDADFRHVTGPLCGVNENFEILTERNLILLLVSDDGGKYDALDRNRDFFEVDPRRPLLPCCASDCDSGSLQKS